MVVKCPNCNQYVSDTASVCPKCGFKLKDDKAKAKDESSSFDEISSFLLKIQIKNSVGWYSFELDNGVCINCNYANSEFQFFIEEFKKQTSDKHFFDARDAYLKFKQSEFFSDFSIEEDECNESHILLNCISRVNSPTPYIAKMLVSVYGVTSPDQIDILESEDSYCVGMSNLINEDSETFEEDSEDSAGIWMNVLCFLIPIVGLILYFVKKNEYPNKAKSYLTWAAAGFGVSILINIIL